MIVCEVGLRDGLQLHPSFLPTEQKLAWIRAEAAAGVREIEVTSYRAAKAGAAVRRCRGVVREALKMPGLSVWR